MGGRTGVVIEGMDDRDVGDVNKHLRIAITGVQTDWRMR